MVIEPHATHGLDGHEGTKKRTDEGHKTTKNRDGAGNDVRNDSVPGGAANPGNPMGGCVASEMLRPAENAHEEVLGREVHEQSCTDEQTRQSNAVADLLHEVAGRAKSRRGNVGSAKVVNHAADGDVDSGHSSLADDEGAGVVTGLAHLRDDVEEGWGSGVREHNR